MLPPRLLLPPLLLLLLAGVMSIEHADFDGIERLALVLGGEIASTFDDPSNVKLGHCKQIEEIMIGEDKLIHFSGEATHNLADMELERSLSPSAPKPHQQHLQGC